MITQWLSYTFFQREEEGTVERWISLKDVLEWNACLKDTIEQELCSRNVVKVGIYLRDSHTLVKKIIQI